MKNLLKEIKKIIYEYRYFLIVLIITFCLISINFPYYIKKDGGTINVQERIKMDHDFEIEGNYKMAYVSELRATIPSLIIANIKKWDIIPLEEEINSNETIKENEYRNKLLLNEANQSALMAAYNSAGKNITVEGVELFITYIDELSKTDLKIGDKILEVNNESISSLEDMKKIINKSNVGDKIKIKIEKNNKQIEKYAEVFLNDGNKIVGIMLTANYEINENVTFEFKRSESGPSGGMIMSLAIYNYITEDISKGRNIVGTGTIDINGNVGEISGVKYKLKGAIKDKADIFLVPSGDNYEEALKVKKENNFDIDIVEVKTLNDAIEYLKKSS